MIYECSLYELRVAHNDIDDAGLADLARALHHPNHLRYVAAWGNRFGKSANAEFHDLYHGDKNWRWGAVSTLQARSVNLEPKTVGVIIVSKLPNMSLAGVSGAASSRMGPYMSS